MQRPDDEKVRPDYVPVTTKPREGEEVWSIQVPGAVHLMVTKNNRHGQAVDARMAIGPNRQGTHFRIKADDRRENQAMCLNPGQDPFRNGMLVRVDGNQQADPETASTDALTTEQLLELFDLDPKDFEARAAAMGEVTLRRMAEVGEAMDVSHKQITYLRELISTRFARGGPQSKLNSADGERLS